ncbi:DUF4136 domain-containing protein [Methylococcus sp. ANG]|uniref:DUF4136 domain-containing protein n=1 Tax=unclassified Methylococcus TaxID=2618889 RepID=UPI001C52C3A7|nr:DUF4136 domain-containing protein [Methylococcus sp. Mc7]QXP83418.1 DUF4136 domain-containing protein [Methylococcus sp. Mc7]
MKPSFAIWAMLLLAACAGPALKSGFDKDYDFVRAKTWSYAVMPGSDQAAVERLRLDTLMKDTLEPLLAAKGYSRREAGADFQVGWSFGEWKIDRRPKSSAEWGAVGLFYPGMHAVPAPNPSTSLRASGRALPPSVDPYGSSYEKAKLDLVVVDGKTQRVVWHASVEDDGDFGYDPDTQRTEIREAVEKAFQAFPPGR